MSEVRSWLDRLDAEVLSEQPDARIEEDFAELHRAGELMEVQRLKRLREIERRRLFDRDGHLSVVAWLASKFKESWGRARDQVRMARALEDMPGTRAALEDGDLSLSAVRILVSARDADPEAFARCERELVEAARIHSTGDLGRIAGYWRQAVEREAALEGEEKLRARRRLRASVTFLGMVRLDGDLDPETGETLLTALSAVLDAEARSRDPDDDRTHAQRRADALGEICRQWLDSSERPTVGGERPHVTVTMGLDAFGDGVNGWRESVLEGSARHRPDREGDGEGDRDRAGGSEGDRDRAGDGEGDRDWMRGARSGPVPRSPDGEHDRGPDGHGEAAVAVTASFRGATELDHVGPAIGPGTARRLACDASVRRVVLAGRSEPLDVGRRTPVVPPAMRRAVIVRDRHCRFPGCDRPHAWCDAHHVVHWADGGPTALPNLVLLCRRHHRMVHQPRGLRLELIDGRPAFRRPDGSLLEERAPP